MSFLNNMLDKVLPATPDTIKPLFTPEELKAEQDRQAAAGDTSPPIFSGFPAAAPEMPAPAAEQPKPVDLPEFPVEVASSVADDTGTDTADTQPVQSTQEPAKGVTPASVPEGSQQPTSEPAKPVKVAPEVGTPAFFEIVKKGLAKSESGNNYFAEAPNSSAHGKYQFLNATRESIMPNVSREAFMASPELQEEAMTKLLQQNLDYAKSRGVDVSQMKSEDAAGMLWAMHLRGAKQGLEVALNSNMEGEPDANGTSPRNYYKRGRLLFAKESGLITDNTADTNPQAGMFKSQGNYDMSTRMGSPKEIDTYSDYFSKVIDGAKQQTTKGQATTAYESLNAALTKINKAAGTNHQLEDLIPNYLGSQGLTSFVMGPQLSGTATKFNELLEEIQAANPNVKLPYKSFEDLKPDMLARTKAYETKAAEANANVGWFDRTLGWVAEVGTSMVSGAPEAASTIAGALIPMAGAGIAAKAAIGAATNAALTVPIQTMVQSNAQDMGNTEAGFAQGAANVATVAGGTAALVVGIEAVKSLLPGALRAGANSVGNMLTKKGANEAADAAAQMGIHDPNIQGLPKLIEANPAGETLEGLADLHTRLTKAEMDLAKDLPVSVAPDSASVPRLQMEYTETQSSLKSVFDEIGGARAGMAKADLPEFLQMQTDAATISSEDFITKMKSPTEPVLPPMQRFMQDLEVNNTTARESFNLTKETTANITKLDEQVSRLQQLDAVDLAEDATRPITVFDRSGSEVEIPLEDFHREIKSTNEFIKGLRGCLLG